MIIEEDIIITITVQYYSYKPRKKNREKIKQ